ncbi:hypothetical protein [Phytomonospora endophytica]|uniref:Uncharacterized protein n=1 Tax=Phytomonospora endophytica TaxID=714109 RepID=A0A841FQT2_9ACTN|nr:hypothetical protein [Phytomonospora endophytica]MBB6038426.1 hypothetical protein [Phytomonospora endophytica]GIG64355.1 hypothetical protein Pen01_06500 [Phytomonospora endophytica]
MAWKRLLRLAALALVGGLVLGMVTGVLTAKAAEVPGGQCVSGRC